MNVEKAFRDALRVFRAVKTKSESKLIISGSEFLPTDHDREILIDMIMDCESFLSGELDAKTALYYIQGLYDSLNKKDVMVQRAMENLKTAVG